MNLSNTWKTTDNPQGPTGNKKSGTFRDISLAGITPEDIDKIDAACMERGMARSDYVLELLSSWKGDAEFNRIFDGTKYADSFWPEIDKNRAPLLGWGENEHRSLRRVNYWRNRPKYREPTEHDRGDNAYSRGFMLLMKEGVKLSEIEAQPSGPSDGRRQLGTFRDLTLVGVDTDEVERIDAVCKQRGILRSDYIVELLCSTSEADDEFTSVFGETRYANEFWSDIDRSEAQQLGWQEVQEIARQRVREWRSLSGELEAAVPQAGSALSVDGPPSEPD